jgi:hypothetical protein
MEISWNDGLKTVEVLRRAKEESNILHTVKIRDVKFKLEWATKAQRGSRCIALLLP